MKCNCLSPFHRWKEQGRTSKPALDRCGFLWVGRTWHLPTASLLRLSPLSFLHRPPPPLPPHWLRLPEGEPEGGGEGGLISAWHQVNSLGQEPDELVAWMLRSRKRWRIPSRRAKALLYWEISPLPHTGSSATLAVADGPSPRVAFSRVAPTCSPSDSHMLFVLSSAGPSHAPLLPCAYLYYQDPQDVLFCYFLDGSPLPRGW